MTERDEGGQPLYRQLAAKLRKRIIDGDFAVGSLLPTEQDLCDTYSTSRFTVREALRLLAEEGMVQRQQGRGTEVVSLTGRANLGQSLSSFAQLFTFAEATRFDIERVMLVVPDEELAMKLGRTHGGKWLLAEGIRRTYEGEVISVTQVFIHDEFAEIAPDLPKLTGAIYRHIEDRFGVGPAQVQQTISMDRASHTIAAQLGIREGDLVVQLLRRYLDADDRPIVISINWHEAKDFRYTQVIRQE